MMSPRKSSLLKDKDFPGAKLYNHKQFNLKETKMVLVKMLKRRDGSSVVTAVVVGLVLYNLLQAVTPRWANWLAGTHNNQTTGYSNDWKVQYLYPVLLAIVELVVLEVLGWIYIWVADAFKAKK